ncbi:hypothetical protein D9757_005804 [Collybiopsis confluens]|uniref:Uncharacterized protein n=1 Tax=Collybiopsis confluens TaxID=2823264 RepID=A0A8H5HPX5_9AGAR|nr:hypothetical protein D9757_005804 [Collybiopsis confluens]
MDTSPHSLGSNYRQRNTLHPSPSAPSSSRLVLSKHHSHAHSRSSSSPSVISDQNSTSMAAKTPANVTSRPNKTSRIMSSVRKSLFVSHSAPPKKLPFDSNTTGMYSTHAERSNQSARFKRRDPSSTPPSIEQIAMGLHISRTPHLRPTPVSNHPYSQRPPLPPPPSRSAMKKPGFSTPSFDPPSASSTTITSSTFPSTPRSNRSLFSLKTRMSRLKPGSTLQPSTMPSSTLSKDSASDLVTPKKAVRFSQSTLALNEQ